MTLVVGGRHIPNVLKFAVKENLKRGKDEFSSPGKT